VQPGGVAPSEVATKFMLHLKITVEDHKASVFVEMRKSILMKLRLAGCMWPVLNSCVGPRNFSKIVNAAKRLQYVGRDVRLDKIVSSVIRESEVFFAVSCIYITDILFLSPKLLSLYPKYVRCLIADGFVLGCLQP
jgi:hypothetical protein